VTAEDKDTLATLCENSKRKSGSIPKMCRSSGNWTKSRLVPDTSSRHLSRSLCHPLMPARIKKK